MPGIARQTVFAVVLVSVMKRFRQSRTLRFILSSAIFISSLLTFTSSAHSACRDPDVAGGFGSLAYAVLSLHIVVIQDPTPDASKVSLILRYGENLVTA